MDHLQQLCTQLCTPECRWATGSNHATRFSDSVPTAAGAHRTNWFHIAFCLFRQLLGANAMLTDDSLRAHQPTPITCTASTAPAPADTALARIYSAFLAAADLAGFYEQRSQEGLSVIASGSEETSRGQSSREQGSGVRASRRPAASSDWSEEPWSAPCITTTATSASHLSQPPQPATSARMAQQNSSTRVFRSCARPGCGCAACGCRGGRTVRTV